MKEYRLLFILLLFCCHIASAQKIEYSKGVVRIPATDDVQLIADIDGYHHLIHFPPYSKPVVSVFNDQLHLDKTIELNINLPANSDVKLVQFSAYYIMYVHTRRTTRHQLIKITGDGTSEDISSIVNKPSDSLWNRSAVPFQLFNIDDSLYLVSHSYHDQIKKVRTAIVKLKRAQDIPEVNQVFSPFDSRYDALMEVTLLENKLLVLKTSKDEEENNTLTLLKFDLLTGKQLSRQFVNGKSKYISPSVRYSAADSGIFIYSLLTKPLGNNEARPGIFMTRLNSSLNEVNPVSILPDVFRDNTAATFIAEQTQTSGWISFSYRVLDGYPATVSPAGIFMMLLNNRLEKAKDSLIKNKGRYFKIHPWPYSHFVLNNTSYLFLVEELAARRKGLLLVYPGKSSFETISVRAYHRYNFALHLLQPVKDKYFIVPFTSKKEMGLMKVTLNN
ncbi:MAG: hypothetical protein JNK14_11965 [Chitinophagaceae bacterium]|nr:hypothetical protein [Chitinophagaceae bacterium]